MVKKIKVYVELSGGEITNVPEWVKTEEDLETFVDEYANNNISVGYDPPKKLSKMPTGIS